MKIPTALQPVSSNDGAQGMLLKRSSNLNATPLKYVSQKMEDDLKLFKIGSSLNKIIIEYELENIKMENDLTIFIREDDLNIQNSKKKCPF